MEKPTQNTKRVTIEIIFWLLLFGSNFSFLNQFMQWHQALIRASVMVALYASFAYFNILLLIPHFFNRKGFVWYGLIVVSFVLIMQYLLGTSDFLFSSNFSLEFHSVRNAGMESGIVKTDEQIKSFIAIIISLLIVLISTSYKLILDSVEKQKAKHKLEKQKMEAEMNMLKNQINPHFFLNALNGLYAYSRISPQKTGDYITKLSDMLRYSTYAAKQSAITLKQEMDYIKDYIYFQQIKDDDIIVEVNEDIKNEDLLIEPLLLIPIVENAFKHSYDERNAKDRIIIINIHQKEPVLFFECKNSLPEKRIGDTKSKYSGIGLENIRLRLETKYQERYHIQYGEEKGFFKLSLKLDLNE
jgi:sensor histidine kinase YesM